MSYLIAGQETIDGSTNAVDTDITLYTLGAGKTLASTQLAITNLGAGDATIRVHIVPNGGSVSKENGLIYDGVLTNDGLPLEVGVGLTLGTAGDTVQVRSDIIDVTFQLFGDEV